MTLPFVFTYRDKVAGRGFLAEVVTHGRLLAEGNSDGWWLYGVQPGDLTAEGKTAADARAEFRKAFTAVLYDIAEDAKDFSEFKADVERFVSQSNNPVLEAWRRAVEFVRESKMASTTKCRVESADTPVTVEVSKTKSSNFTPADNILEPDPAIAA